MTTIRCDSCQGEFELESPAAGEAKDGRVECRHCGAVVPVRRAEAASALREDALAEDPAEYERLIAEICEPASVPGQIDTLSPAEHSPAPREVAGTPAPPPTEAARKTQRETAREPRREAVEEPAGTARIRPACSVSRSVVLDPGTLAENRVVACFPEAPEVEVYRVLRTRVLQAIAEKGGNTVMITSALPLEGKTLTAINLALTFSKGHLETALLVDCDLRQQKVHKTLGYDSGKGLGDYLAEGCAVSEIMVWPGVEKFSVISGGRPVTESSELLGSPAMAGLVRSMKGRYGDRYVFLDAPCVLNGADALVLAPLVDHILFVVRAGYTPLPEARRALEMLPAEKVVGVVLNRQAGA